MEFYDYCTSCDRWNFIEGRCNVQNHEEDGTGQCCNFHQGSKIATAKYFDNLRAKGKLTPGQGYAYRAYYDSRYRNSNVLEVEELPWGEDNLAKKMFDFVSTLRSAGIHCFTVTDRSTALMEGLHALVSVGAKIQGPKIVIRKPDYSEEPELRKGLLITI